MFKWYVSSILLFGAMVWGSFYSNSLAQSGQLKGSVYHKVDIKFKAEQTYDNPIDLKISVIFEGPSNQRIRQQAFWNGASVFRVRFAAPDTGRWTYNTICSNEHDSGLHNQTGSIQVSAAPDSATQLEKHGWLKLSENGRYLVYADGTPFFWLGDTAWEISWKSTQQQLETYLDDRAAKGFSAVQFVPLTHQRLFKNGVVNRNGEPFFQEKDFDRINPRYFDYIDRIVDGINDRGMVAVIVPLWASKNELHFDQRYSDYALNREQSLRVARYIGARYAGNAVVWIVGGDNTYETEKQQNFWSEFARTLEDATADRQLITVHPSGWNASFDYFGNEVPWLDFHMYQASHIARGDYTWKAAREGWSREPVMPVLNAEGPYEDIYNRLWAPGDTSRVETFRIRPKDVRQAAYESILNGAKVGYTYGANGVWQWHVKGLWASHQPRFHVMQAIELPGSRDMSVMKEIMKEYDWNTLKPAMDRVITFKGRDRPSMGIGEQRGLLFMPSGTRSVRIAWSPRSEILSSQFIDPENGLIQKKVNSGHIEKKGGSLRIIPPDTTDWLLGFEFKSGYDKRKGVKLYQNVPNPFNSTTNITYQINRRMKVDITVYDVRGRLVNKLTDGIREEGIHTVGFAQNDLASGMYLVVLKTPKKSVSRKMLLVK